MLMSANLKSLAVADKAAFRNCLVSMRPKAVRQDIPSTHQVTTYIHNEFVKWLNVLKSDILVSLYQYVISESYYFTTRQHQEKFR